MRTTEQLIQDTTPFPDTVIEQIPGRSGGPQLDYVAWQQYAQRLLLHHPDHSWEVTEITHAGNTWAVVGAIVIDGVRYAGVGEDTGPASAESNAYKRASAHAGIGLHLYGGYWLHDRLQKGTTGDDPE